MRSDLGSFDRARLRTAALAAAAVISITAPAAGAPAASEAAAYDAGKALYQTGQHAQAVAHFAQAIEGASPSIRDGDLVNQARMLWGASAMYLGRLADADLQFERILRGSPKFEPDALLFPPGVLTEFRRIREKLEKEAAEKRAGDANTRRIAALEAANTNLETQLGALRAFARYERVVVRRSRVIASIPFGVGQFQNGEVALGIFFAATEGLALTTATVSYAFHSSLPIDPIDANQARSAASAARVINWISIGTFVALAVGGIAQAHVALVEESSELRQRPLPRGLGAGASPVGVGLARADVSRRTQPVAWSTLRPIGGPTEGGGFALGLAVAF
jgi:hypothetical protein